MPCQSGKPPTLIGFLENWARCQRPTIMSKRSVHAWLLQTIGSISCSWAWALTGILPRCFPGTAALHVRDRWCVANSVPKSQLDRVTLTFPIFNIARRVVLLVTGINKAEALRSVVTKPIDLEQRPAQGVCPAHGEFGLVRGPNGCISSSTGGSDADHVIDAPPNRVACRRTLTRLLPRCDHSGAPADGWTRNKAPSSSTSRTRTAFLGELLRNKRRRLPYWD